MSGSSPCSDISQPASQDGMRRLMSKKGKWKMFVRATSPESTSRSSSKTGRETPENGETGNSCFTLNFKDERCGRKFLHFPFFVPSSAKKRTALYPFTEILGRKLPFTSLNLYLYANGRVKILKGWHLVSYVFTTDWGLLLPQKQKNKIGSSFSFLTLLPH